MQHHSLLVEHIQPCGETHTVTAPYDLSPIATLDVADESIVEQALQNASDLYEDRAQWLPLYQRLAILERTAAIMSERVEDLTLQAAQEGGKPYIDSKVEVIRAIDGVKLCIETMRTNAGEVIPMGINPASVGKYAFTQYEPIGVVVAVSAFNHPLNLIVHQVAPAIATGCPVIVKPAKSTPISCMNFVNILYEAGLPKAWCQAVVIQEASLSTRLVSDNRVAFLSFIGSAKVGWMLRSKLAPGARCALEHGGAAPVIVAEDADMTEALPRIAKGGFYHAGQVCVSVQRVFAHKSIAKDLANQLADLANQLKVGNPTLSDVEVGPLISPAECTRVDEWVKQAAQDGAEILCGGEPVSETCYQPTVLFNPDDHAQVSQHEIFGPVICVYEYDNLDEAIARANQLPLAFQAAVFSQNLTTCMLAYQGLAASAVMVNDHTAFRVDWMPFAGLKESGHGVGGIPHTIEDMQIQKMMVLHHGQTR